MNTLAAKLQSKNVPLARRDEASWTLERDRLFAARDRELIWKKYCGFLDLSLDEFMIMQKLLLMEQIDLVANSPLGARIMGGRRPRNIYEFRKLVPLTRYKDYAPWLDCQDEAALAEKPLVWGRTSGKTGCVKWCPYPSSTLGALADDTIAAFILSSASRKGEVLLNEGARVVLNLPTPPLATGIMARAARQRIKYRAIPSLERAEQMDFEVRIEQGFKEALQTGIDYAASIAAVLARVSEDFSQMGKRSKTLYSWHPAALYRQLTALTKSKLRGRPLLPKDLWKVKGLVCGGTDASIYRDEIFEAWGVQPLDVYASTESGFIAMQAWNKKGMTFLPYRNFFEFIPQEEYLQSQADPAYNPSTVLLDEVRAGETYELVITNLHAGPFLRYRIGDLIRITALRDDETRVNLPQMEFYSRADDVIDIAGFARLDEKGLAKSLKEAGVTCVDWLARKEESGRHPVLHLYLEMKNGDSSEADLKERIGQRLAALNPDFAEYRRVTGQDPLVVSLLEKGSFDNYLRKKSLAQVDVAHLKPPHMNASDAVLSDLISH